MHEQPQNDHHRVLRSAQELQDHTYLEAVVANLREICTQPPQSISVDKALVATCLIALTDSPRDEALAFFERLLRRGMPPEELFENIFPQIAIDLGCAWEKDTVSFADVTLIMTSLQRIAQSLRQRYISAPKQQSPSLVLIATLSGETHFFPALLIAAKLERAGFPVRLLQNATAETLIELAKRHEPLAIGLSCSTINLQQKLREVIDDIRRKSALPILVGGVITQTDQTKILTRPVNLWGNDWDELRRYLQELASNQLQNVNQL